VIAGIWDGRGWRDPLGYDTRKLGIGGTDTLVPRVRDLMVVSSNPTPATIERRGTDSSSCFLTWALLFLQQSRC
jgi:hypothetical protein